MILAALTAFPPPKHRQELIANRTLQARSLGRARYVFFEAILRVSRRHEGIDYAGYRSMMMMDHTTMYWPIGRADEVVFLYHRSGGALLTRWGAQKGVPRRLLQVSLDEGERPLPDGGTLAKPLGNVKATVPRRYAKPGSGSV